MSVYFITAREVGMVKIGCAYEPARRMAHMQTMSPCELALEAIFPGAYQEEKELHLQFASQRVRGEWFRITPEIEAVIASAPPPPPPRNASIEERAAVGDIHFPFRAIGPLSQAEAA